MGDPRAAALGAMAIALAVGADARGQCEMAKLLASDGTAGSVYGFSASVSGDVAVAGAPRESETATAAGAAYVSRRDGNVWNEEAKLLASDGAEFDQFGHSTSVSGDVVVSGAFGDDDDGNASGSAYVYRWDGSVWNEEQRLAATGLEADDQFGFSVAVDGDVIVVGAPGDDDNGNLAGAAYVYRWDGGTWIEEQKLLPDDGFERDEFGFAVALHEDVALISAHFNDDLGTNSGAAYTFRYDGETWNQEQKLTADDGDDGDEYGFSVAVRNDVVLIGAEIEDEMGRDAGAAYAYRWDGDSWTDEQKLLAADGEAFDQFGYAVAVDGDVAVVTSRTDNDGGTDTGSAYVYRWDGLAWNLNDKLIPADAQDFDQFGSSAGLSGDYAVVGARLDDDNGVDSGSAYIWDLLLCNCPGDLNRDGEVTFADVLIVLQSWGDTGGPADIDGSGTVDFGDILDLLAGWGSCPGTE